MNLVTSKMKYIVNTIVFFRMKHQQVLVHVFILFFTMEVRGWCATNTRRQVPRRVVRVSTAWQRQQSELVRERYEAARMIASPPLFALTQQDANAFQRRFVSKEFVRINSNCDKKLSKYTKSKIEELSEVFNTTQCQPPSSTGSTTQRPRRRRRETVMENEDGSVTTISGCFQRRSLTDNGNLRLCTECQATTVLPETV